jgi:hypothetical protein
LPFAGLALGFGIWWVATGFRSIAQVEHGITNDPHPRKAVPKVNVKRMMVRVDQILAVVLALLVLGSALWWVAMGGFMVD